MMYSSPDASGENSNDLFMKEFKLFKQFKRDLNSLNTCKRDCDDKFKSSFVNTTTISDDSHIKCDFGLRSFKLKTENFHDENLNNFGLKNVNQIKCYELTDTPGLLIIPCPFRKGFQRYFVKKCLTQYHNLPNKTNLDLHMNRDGVNLWENAIERNDFAEFNKLRWATIGYHYDWTNKVYNGKDFTPLPVDISNLAKTIARLIGYPDYEPEAGIINYYHLNSTLSGHQDHSEKNMNAPLISISFGSSAFFLVGGQTKNIRPAAILLNSGDVVVMKDEARLAYHGVPKILKNENIQQEFQYEIDEYFEQNFKKKSAYYVSDQEWYNRSLFDYIKLNRINLNIRQVN